VSPSDPIDRETWARIHDLFHRALERPEEERAAFLAEACDDPRVRAEVASLLESHSRAADFIETPTVSASGVIHPRSDTPIPDRIGHYRLICVLGEGGMGLVYLAEDTRLGRTVALKALAPRFVGDATRRERLRREARAAAALNHPGIATVYALEEIDDHLYIAGEYVPGETLRDELFRGPLDPARAIETGIAIARALAVAHQRGIVHRDLKPENVIRTPSGDLKVLDFGLARFSDLSELKGALTSDGMILGTPAYMSPEQIRGATVDARSDLFSLGVILYELVTGFNPFAGADPASTIAKILELEPARITDSLPPGVMPGSLGQLERVVATCLRKSPNARYESATELAGALEEARDRLVTGHSTHRRDPVPSAPVPASHAVWWWRFHQTAATIAYLLLLIPLWNVRDMPPESRWTRTLFVAGLVGVVVANALRWHSLFAVHLNWSAWREERARSARWIRAGDVLFVGALAIVGVLALLVSKSSGILLVAAAAAVLVSFAVIEPATTRAAFGETPTTHTH
jgi:serine/threonine protein kinase